MKEQLTEQLLWNYIDGSATAAEKSFVEKMLAESAAWRAKYAQQLELHQLLINETETEQPSMRFSKNVMESLAGMEPKAATRSYINKNIIRSIAAFFILSMTSLLVLALVQADWSATSNSSNLIPINTEKINLPQFDVSKLFNSTVLNALVMITVVLGLMMFDGFLRRKKSAA